MGYTYIFPKQQWASGQDMGLGMGLASVTAAMRGLGPGAFRAYLIPNTQRACQVEWRKYPWFDTCEGGLAGFLLLDRPSDKNSSTSSPSSLLAGLPTPSPIVPIIGELVSLLLRLSMFTAFVWLICVKVLIFEFFFFFLFWKFFIWVFLCWEMLGFMGILVERLVWVPMGSDVSLRSFFF